MIACCKEAAFPIKDRLEPIFIGLVKLSLKDEGDELANLNSFFSLEHAWITTALIECKWKRSSIFSMIFDKTLFNGCPLKISCIISMFSFNSCSSRNIVFHSIYYLVVLMGINVIVLNQLYHLSF